MKGFTVDGLAWEHFCEIRRVADVTPTDISGYLLTGAYFNDVQGTYHSYEITVAVPMRERDAYAALYEVLTQPVDGHVFVLPYNSTTVTLTARVTQIPDAFYPVGSDGAYWLAQKFTIVSNYPTKRLSLGEVLTRGMAPGPDLSAPAVGETWTWDGTAWVEYSPPTYQDADNMEF